MSPLVIAVGGVVLLGGGYLAYKFVQASSPIDQLTTLASQSVSSAESLLSEDPLSVTSVYGDVKSGATKAYDEVAGWF